MSHERLENLNEEKRRRIMEIALDEFLEMNFKTASINKISKKAGISTGALYYYFEDKEDLFYTTIEYVTIELWDEMGSVEEYFDKKGYWKGIKDFVSKRLELTQTHPKYMKLFYRVLNSNDPVELAGKKRFMKPFTEIFDYGYSNGYIRRDLPKDLIYDIHLKMTVSVNNWSLEHQLNHEKVFDLDEISDKTIEMIRASIGMED